MGPIFLRGFGGEGKVANERSGERVSPWCLADARVNFHVQAATTV